MCQGCGNNSIPFIRAFSSVGQSYRLITGWSKVRVLQCPLSERTNIIQHSSHLLLIKTYFNDPYRDSCETDNEFRCGCKNDSSI